MILRPAYETTLRHGNHAVTLRASLRAAVALDQLPGGIPGACESVMRQSYSGIRQVILATATDRAGAELVFASLSDRPLASFMGVTQAACLDLLDNLLPEPDHAPEATAPAMPAKPVSIRDYLTDLFRFGAVTLAWSASEVWNTSPAELEVIARAHLDRHEALEAAMNGKDPSKRQMTAAQRQANIDAGLDPDFDRHALQALKARHSA